MGYAFTCTVLAAVFIRATEEFIAGEDLQGFTEVDIGRVDFEGQTTKRLFGYRLVATAYAGDGRLCGAREEFLDWVRAFGSFGGRIGVVGDFEFVEQ